MLPKWAQTGSPASQTQASVQDAGGTRTVWLSEGKTAPKSVRTRGPFHPGGAECRSLPAESHSGETRKPSGQTNRPPSPSTPEKPQCSVRHATHCWNRASPSGASRSDPPNQAVGTRMNAANNQGPATYRLFRTQEGTLATAKPPAQPGFHPKASIAAPQRGVLRHRCAPKDGVPCARAVQPPPNPPQTPKQHELP